VEFSGGYGTNPGRLSVPQGNPVYVIAPNFWPSPTGSVMRWSPICAAPSAATAAISRERRRHAVGGAARYRPSQFHRPYRRPARRYQRYKAARSGAAAGLDRQSRQPERAGGLARYRSTPRSAAPSVSTQNFNRLQVSGATVDRTYYQWSNLTDGTSTSNDDRNFNQYGGVGRISYDLMPGVKPFVEGQADKREHDEYLDRNGYARNSTGGYVKGGSSFEFSRLLFGEISIGYAARDYVDPRLQRLDGLLTSASLTWTATPLTTAKFYSDTQIAETTLAGTSGVLVRTYTFEVDHDFRRWLTGIGRFTYGTLDYQGDDRTDKVYTLSSDLIYRMTRSLWLKGTLRRDWLESTSPGSSSSSTVVMLGVRLQN
jgi:hypothetical protein